MNSFPNPTTVALATTTAFFAIGPQVSSGAEIIRPQPPTVTKQTSTPFAGFSQKKNLPQYEIWPEATRRLAFLADLGDDHDGEGGRAAVKDSMTTAIIFVRQLPYYAPDPRVGMNSEGHAVVEFHDGDEVGQIIFGPDREAEFFHMTGDNRPIGFDGSVDNPIIAQKFLDAFGFRLAA